MPLGELLHKWKHGIPMSNGRKIKSQAQAIAIAANEGYIKGKKRGKKNLRKVALDRAMKGR